MERDDHRALVWAPAAAMLRWRMMPAQRQTISLVTTGHRSGQAREVRLYAFPDGEGLVIVGSWGGAARDPAWVANLRAHPRAVVRVGRQSREVEAREVDAGDRDRLWARVCAAFPLYEAYQRRTKRVIPLFVLESPGDRTRSGG